MKKRMLFLIICIIGIFSISAFSDDQNISMYIDQILVETSAPVIEHDGEILIPMIETFRYLGAEVSDGEIITSYYLNTFVKIDLENDYYAINGKKYLFETQNAMRNRVLYVPLALLQKAFDLTIDEKSDNQLFLKANRVIQYRNYDAIQYEQVSFEEDGVRFSIPLDWNPLGGNAYGYDSSYGRISVNFSSRILNDNIDTKVIVDTYEEHLLMAYGDRALIEDSKQQIYNYLTSNVLYIALDVNDIKSRRVVHFIESEEHVYIMEFNYPVAISETYMQTVIRNIMDAFFIDAVTFDDHSEHYLETKTALDYNLVLSSDIYSNMTVRDHLILEGYFNTNTKIDALTVTVSRKDNSLEFIIPVENNAFSADIYTPFGLGKHNIQIAIAGNEQKVIFDPITLEPILSDTKKNLMWFSVVNISDADIRYTIPTKMVQSHDDLITSMSSLIAYKYHTDYSKARAIYDFINKEIDILPLNEVNYSALDVYETFQGTKKEIAFYFTALLRAQDIPARMVEGVGEFSKHIWVEAYLNGKWLILDPVGDTNYLQIITSGEVLDLKPSFNAKRSTYRERYPIHNIMEY